MQRAFMRAIVAAAAVSVATVGIQTSVSAKAATLTVGNPATCKGATYPTISAAVAAAHPGDTIRVCPGMYPENVAVTIPLTFLGAQAGHDARHGRNDQSKESVVNNVSGDFSLTGGANNVTIDGFTITGAGADSSGPNDYGIEAFQGTSGLVVVNNVITGNREGMNYQNPNGGLPSSIRHNAFSNNSTGQDAGGSGTGVFISNGPANNTSITENSFTGHTQTAINFAGNGSNHSVGLAVTNNTSVDDATFVVATDSNGAVVSRNTISVVSAANGTAILDYGCNVNLSIDNNMISGGAVSATSGINVRNLCGTPSVNTTVTNNHVANRYNGIRVTGDGGLTPGTGATGATISGNHITGSSHDGIFMELGANNSFQHNDVQSSAVHDCEDDTTGSGTAGTANTWTSNMGKSNNSMPPAICPGH